MFIYRQQILNTLNTLCAPHVNLINGYREKYPPADPNSDEAVKLKASLKALVIYNSFKQKYQPSV